MTTFFISLDSVPDCLCLLISSSEILKRTPKQRPATFIFSTFLLSSCPLPRTIISQHQNFFRLNKVHEECHDRNTSEESVIGSKVGVVQPSGPFFCSRLLPLVPPPLVGSITLITARSSVSSLKVGSIAA